MWERVSYPDKALDEVWKSQEAQLFEKSGLMVKMAFGLDAD